MSSAAGQLVVRDGRREDLPAVHRMIYELAAYEGMPDGPQLSVEGEPLLTPLPSVSPLKPFWKRTDQSAGKRAHKHFLQICAIIP
ncbi:hypothetical protein RR48_05855 [Papilio machaon]|uniref:Diamine acetyltransferase 2 n=1 Tax=Papilio machaon TaxID=76193 RepID=A0A0N1IFK2_PAPMA|nr:hypothetical protein RR48_05855 [Papilio machaon]